MNKKEKQFSELISTLSAILDLDENIKLYHAWRTAIIAFNMAEQLIPHDSAQVFFAGLLHDVGAVGLKDHIVHYTDLKDIRDQPIIFNHPIIGAKIVKEIPGLELAAQYILDHHETVDGQGYPAKKGAEFLSLGSQILHIADQLDLLLRVDSLNRTDIYNIFRQKKGKKFAYELWPVFLDMINSDTGTFFYMLKEKSGYMRLMKETLTKVTMSELSLPDNFLDQTIRVFAKIIDAKHSYTHGHTERVVEYSTIIARYLNLNKEEILKLKRSAYLHDIGKLGVPLDILDKKERLTDEEFYKVKQHIIITMEVLDSLSFLRDLTEISGYHHARWDGSGYPDLIQGEAIPLGARIITIADSFDAMTSSRAYRKALSFEFAFNELRKHAGTQFDPVLIAKIDNPHVIKQFEEIYLTNVK